MYLTIETAFVVFGFVACVLLAQTGSLVAQGVSWWRVAGAARNRRCSRFGRSCFASPGIGIRIARAK